MSTPTKIKALWLASWYPNETNRSLGDYVQRQAKAVSPYCDITIIAVFPSDKIKKAQIVINKLDNDLKEIIVYQPMRNRTLVGNVLRVFDIFLGIRLALHQLPKSWKSDIIHLHICHPMAFFAYILAKWKGQPLVISEHSSMYIQPKDERSLLEKLISVRVLNFATKVLVVSQHLKDNIIAKGVKSEVLLVNNVVDSNFFFDYQVTPRERGEKFNWIHTSTFAQGIKNVEGILRAIVVLSKERNDFLVRFIGGNSTLVNKYSEMAQQSGIQDFVSFETEITQTQLKHELLASDGFVCFSNYETFGLSVVEALCMGLPTIATKTGIFEELIFKKEGELIEIGYEDQLVAAMEKIMDNYDQYSTDQAESYIRDKYSFEAVGSQICCIYQHILSKKI